MLDWRWDLSEQSVSIRHNLIIVTEASFDVKFSNAYQTTRLGYCHAFPRIGIDAHMVKHHWLVKAAEELDNPIFWLTSYDYDVISNQTLKMLRKYPHFVQVNTFFEGMEELHEGYGAPGPAVSNRVLERMIYSEPKFVWCSAHEDYFEFYAGWFKTGFHVVSLPWACDSARYFPMPNKDYDDVQVAFVGGYRGYKEPQYQEYLSPYADKLKVWGYSEWPERYNYQGYLDNNEEKYLYHNARLCPTISEPQFEVTGDTVERPFKILGSGGLTVFDCNLVYRKLFKPSEALIPNSLNLYHAMVQAMLQDDDVNKSYRDAGYRAIQERHTYRHRALKIVAELGL